MDAHCYCLCDDEIMINALKFNFKKVSQRTNLCPKFIKLYYDRMDWKIYCRYNTITIDLIERYEPYINWYELNLKQLPDDILEAYPKKFNWAKITLYATDQQLVKFQKFINRDAVMSRKTIPDELIDRYCDKVGWHSIVPLMNPIQIDKYVALKKIYRNYSYTIEDGLQLYAHAAKKIAEEKTIKRIYDMKTILLSDLNYLLGCVAPEKVFTTNITDNYIINKDKFHLNTNLDDDFIIKHAEMLQSTGQLKKFLYHTKKLSIVYPNNTAIRCMVWKSFSEYDIDCYLEENQKGNKMFWNMVSTRHNLNHKMICKYQEYLNWDIISKCQILTPETMVEFEDKLNWHFVIKNQTNIPPTLLFKYSVIDRIKNQDK